MSYPGPGPQPTLLIVDGNPVSGSNPLPTTGGGGGGGTVDQGKAGSAPQSWYIQDGSGLLATAAKQDTGNTALSNILGQLDAKTSTLATASAQTTGNTSLATIATQQTDGTQKTQVTSSALPTGAATAAKQPALGTAGTPSADVLSVQGVVGGTPQPISATALPLPTGAATSALQGGGLPAALVGGKLDVNLGTSSITLPVSGPLTDAQLRATSVPVSQGAGSGAAGTFWYTRNTDGTNTQPTMDTAARSGFQRITDGTNTAAVKAASTAPTASDTASVVTLSPNSRPGGGSSFTWFSTATGSLLKTGAGVVRRIIIGSNVAGTVTLHDNTSAAGTVITSVTSTTSTPCNQVELGVAFSTGLYCTTTGSGISVTVVYD